MKNNDKYFLGWLLLFLLVIIFSSQKSPDYKIEWINNHQYIITSGGGVCHLESCESLEHYESE